MKTCPQCEKTYPDSERFCQADGTALVPLGGSAAASAGGGAAIECPVCGGKAEPGEAICNFCGARLAGGAAASQPGQQPQPSRTTQRVFDEEPLEASAAEGSGAFGRIGYALAALVALAAGIWLALWLSKRPTPTPIAEATPTAALSPAPSGPLVALASKVGLQVTGESAAAPERDQAAARKLYDDNQSGLLDTYKGALASDANLHDGLLVRLRITPDGSADAAKVLASTNPNPALDADVVKTMMGWKFAPFSGTQVEADYPLIFARDASERDQLDSALAAAHPGSFPEYSFGYGTPVPTSVPAPVVTMAPAPPTPALPPEVAEHPRPRPKPRPTPKPSLLTLVKNRLRTDRRFNRVNAYTDPNGTVTLFGTVFDNKAKLAAEHAAREVSGVTHVVDNLNTDVDKWHQQEQQVMEQLRNSGLPKVTVKIIGNDAYLNGEASTDLEKQRAVTVTQGAARVTVRVNLIRVVPPSLF